MAKSKKKPVVDVRFERISPFMVQAFILTDRGQEWSSEHIPMDAGWMGTKSFAGGLQEMYEISQGMVADGLVIE
jgi:hypothetical protein